MAMHCIGDCCFLNFSFCSCFITFSLLFALFFQVIKKANDFYQKLAEEQKLESPMKVEKTKEVIDIE